MPCLDCTRWTPPSGARNTRPTLLDTYHRVFDRVDAVVGEHVWNFADFATGPSFMRVDGNKKGVFTRDRRPEGRRAPFASTVARRFVTAAVELAYDQLAEELRRLAAPSRAAPRRSSGLLGGQADGRQRRCDHGRHGDVVEADDAQVPGNGDAEAGRPAMTPSAIWSLKAITAVEAVLTTRGRLPPQPRTWVPTHVITSTSNAGRDRPVFRTAARRSTAAHEPVGPRGRRAAGDRTRPDGGAPRGQRVRSAKDRRMTGNRAAARTPPACNRGRRGRDAAARRKDDESVDVVREQRPGGPDLLLGCSPVSAKQDLQVDITEPSAPAPAPWRRSAGW